MRMIRMMSLAGSGIAVLTMLGATVAAADAGTTQTEAYAGPGEFVNCPYHDLTYGGIEGIPAPPTGVDAPPAGTCFEIPSGSTTFDITTVDATGKTVIAQWNFTDSNGNVVVDSNGLSVRGFSCSGATTQTSNPVPASAAEVYVFQDDPASAAATQLTGVSCPNIGAPPTIGTETVSFHA